MLLELTEKYNRLKRNMASSKVAYRNQSTELSMIKMNVQHLTDSALVDT